jgi:hypothetical protein
LCASLQTRPISGSVYRSITDSFCRSVAVGMHAARGALDQAESA